MAFGQQLISVSLRMGIYKPKIVSEAASFSRQDSGLPWWLILYARAFWPWFCLYGPGGGRLRPPGVGNWGVSSTPGEDRLHWPGLGWVRDPPTPCPLPITTVPAGKGGGLYSESRLLGKICQEYVTDC